MVEVYKSFEPREWFWIVGGDDTRFWSSAAAAYVEELPDKAGVTRIASEGDLNDVLASLGLRGPIVTVADIVAERDRRLALGFDYDFGDDRGVHRIGTTPQDWIGWSAVTTLANALIATDGTASITISTDSGVALVTALEWQQVLLSGGAIQQPIWLASFALAAMSPIPNDYENDSYWNSRRLTFHV
ncbi:MAG: hypothetical protein EKK63_10070 [Acinetobacter sp.]|uniref:hypothetical protein n=1 Tax=Acinetobacter sp. TaxID=472 RepID=UPI000F9084EE|nr:hypothetical protein [Acinetobacter sp.]RUP39336.1 MAG: hypothetical protein EKK63_10070 [Acinetobacter sp.]